MALHVHEDTRTDTTVVVFTVDFEAEEARDAARARGLIVEACGDWDEEECGVRVTGPRHAVSDWEFYDC